MFLTSDINLISGITTPYIRNSSIKTYHKRPIKPFGLIWCWNLSARILILIGRNRSLKESYKYVLIFDMHLCYGAILLICNFILQVSLYFPVPLLCGTLIMLSQVMKNMPDIERNLEFPEENVIKDEAAGLEILANLKKFEDDSDEEKYFDAKTDVSINLKNSQVKILYYFGF